jgi:hypothetical protein
VSQSAFGWRFIANVKLTISSMIKAHCPRPTIPSLVNLFPKKPNFVRGNDDISPLNLINRRISRNFF